MLKSNYHEYEYKIMVWFIRHCILTQVIKQWALLISGRWFQVGKSTSTLSNGRQVPNAIETWESYPTNTSYISIHSSSVLFVC